MTANWHTSCLKHRLTNRRIMKYALRYLALLLIFLLVLGVQKKKDKVVIAKTAISAHR